MSLYENEHVQQLKLYNDKELPKQDIIFNISNIEDCILIDEFGNNVRFGDIYIKKKSIIVFLRHFLCFTTSDYVEDLMKVPKCLLEENRVQIILIVVGDYRSIREFRYEMGCDFPIFVDPKLDLYANLKFKNYIDANYYENSNAHIKSGLVYGIFRSTLRAMRYSNKQGTVQQNGGSLVIGTDSKILFYHIDKTIFDKALINDLLVAAGAPPISFKNDPRVETV